MAAVVDDVVLGEGAVKGATHHPVAHEPTPPIRAAAREPIADPMPALPLSHSTVHSVTTRRQRRRIRSARPLGAQFRSNSVLRMEPSGVRHIRFGGKCGRPSARGGWADGGLRAPGLMRLCRVSDVRPPRTANSWPSLTLRNGASPTSKSVKVLSIASVNRCSKGAPAP